MKDRKELKYPIKYAVMPIEEQIGWAPGLNELKREDGVVANIVSKCYIIGERKEYLRDGTFKIKYEVVFPYVKKDLIYGNFKPVIPEYNYHFQCMNSIFVSQLFSSFEKAHIAADIANEEILGHALGVLPCNEKAFKKAKEEHQATLDRYKIIEEKMEQETCDMEITKTYSSTLEYLIEKVVESPSEFYNKLASVLSIEEREFLKQLIENRSCNNCTNDSCSVANCEKVGLDECGEPQGSNCLGWNNNELIGRQRILRLL